MISQEAVNIFSCAYMTYTLLALNVAAVARLF